MQRPEPGKVRGWIQVRELHDRPITRLVGRFAREGKVANLV